MQVALPGGRSVPLSQFATFSYGLDAAADLAARPQVPNLTVAADVTPGTLPETVVSALQPSIDALRKTLPPAYSIAVGGTVEESAKSQSLSHRRRAGDAPAHVHGADGAAAELQGCWPSSSASAPLGLIGVVGALLLSGKPLGFVALLGILALIGIITRTR